MKQMLGWMNTSWNQDCRRNPNNLRYAGDTYGRKRRRTKEPLDGGEEENEKAHLKLNIQGMKS